MKKRRREEGRRRHVKTGAIRGQTEREKEEIGGSSSPWGLFSTVASKLPSSIPMEMFSGMKSAAMVRVYTKQDLQRQHRTIIAPKAINDNSNKSLIILNDRNDINSNQQKVPATAAP